MLPDLPRCLVHYEFASYEDVIRFAQERNGYMDDAIKYLRSHLSDLATTELLMLVQNTFWELIDDITAAVFRRISHMSNHDLLDFLKYFAKYTIVQDTVRDRLETFELEQLYKIVEVAPLLRASVVQHMETRIPGMNDTLLIELMRKLPELHDYVLIAFSELLSSLSNESSKCILHMILILGHTL